MGHNDKLYKLSPGKIRRTEDCLYMVYSYIHDNYKLHTLTTSIMSLWYHPVKCKASTAFLARYGNGRIASSNGKCIVPLAEWQTVWFMHHGIPAPFAHGVKHLLDSQYPQRSTVPNRPVFWSPRSPDLSPADFYLGNNPKDIVHGKTVNARDEL